MSRQIYKQQVTYFIQGEVTQRIKIGHTTTAASERLRQMQTGSPDLLIFLGACFGSEKSETFLHNKFSNHRLHGEWFNPHPEILEYIEENCIYDESAFFYAYREIDQGNMTYDEALKMGTSKLKEISDQETQRVLMNMYTTDAGYNEFSDKNITNGSKTTR